MLDSIKRLFGGAPAAIEDWAELQAWARQRQWAMRTVREPRGFAIDGCSGDTPWRLEWGPSQRPYIQGGELRLRAELGGVPRELQALVLSRELMESMERSVFDRYVEGVQTRIDTETPAEMRWLVMFPKLGGHEMKALRDSFGALSNSKPWLLEWLAGELSAALAPLPQSALTALVLIVARRRLSLRMALAHPAVEDLQRCVQVFDCALNAARQVSIDFNEPSTASTMPSLFPASVAQTDAERA